MKRNRYLFFSAMFLLLMQAFFINMGSFNQILNLTYIAIKPFIYAIFIAILMIPMVNYFEKKLKLKRIISMIFSFFIVFITFLILLLLIIPNLIESLGDLIEKTPILLKSLTNHLEETIKFLRVKKILLMDSNEIEDSLIEFVKRNIGNLKIVFFSLSSGILKSIGVLANLFMAVFISCYLIYSKEYFLQFRKNILSFFCNKKQTEYMIDFFNKSNDIFLNYITGRILTSAVVGGVVFVILFITKVPYALLSGVLIGVGNMIPYVGSLVAGAIATFLIFLISPIKLIYLFIAIVVGQTVDGFIIGPKIMEESVGMSSFWTIISIMICGNLFGPVGMFLGVPVFAVLKIIYQERLNKIKEQEVKNE